MMKTKKRFLLFSKIFLTVVIFLFCSCAKTDQIEDGLKGTLKLNIVMPSDVRSNNSVKSISEDSITVSIYRNNNKDALLSFNGINHVPETIDLSEGSYQVKAFSTYYPEVAFENPCYYGESDFFNIVSEEPTSVSFNCYICNIPIKITYSEGTTNSFGPIITSVYNGTDSLVYNEEEDRTGYFKPNSLTIKSYLSYGTKTKIITREIENPQPGIKYTININTKLPGNISVTISFNDNTKEMTFDLTDDGFVEQSDEYSFGDLIITEFMSAPDEGDGEWIEIYNNTDEDQNLNGLVLRREGGTSDITQINSDVIVSSHEYAVLAGSDNATDNVNYTYDSGFTLNNDNNYTLYISTWGMDGLTGFPIFWVNLEDEDFKTNKSGKSMQLNLTGTTVIDATEAQKGDNWSNGSVTYSTGDYGTPGYANTEIE